MRKCAASEVPTTFILMLVLSFSGCKNQGKNKDEIERLADVGRVAFSDELGSFIGSWEADDELQFIFKKVDDQLVLRMVVTDTYRPDVTNMRCSNGNLSFSVEYCDTGRIEFEGQIYDWSLRVVDDDTLEETVTLRGKSTSSQLVRRNE